MTAPGPGIGELLDDAIGLYADVPAAAARLRAQRDRLDEPLRVGLVGRVKAGKSTLLNALVGERLAPTDAGECTRVVTWYRNGPIPRVVLHPSAGRRGCSRSAGPTAPCGSTSAARRWPTSTGWRSTGRPRRWPR